MRLPRSWVNWSGLATLLAEVGHRFARSFSILSAAAGRPKPVGLYNS